MTNPILINELQRDALQETMNISMGQAANALAQLINIRVILSIPKISMTSPEGLQSFYQASALQHFARQSFLGDMHGEVISMISDEGCKELGEAMSYDQPMDSNSIDELVLELTNILAGACLKGMVDQLGCRLHLAAPSLFEPAQQAQGSYHWHHALLLEILFALEHISFSSRVVICLDEASITVLADKLNEMLD